MKLMLIGCLMMLGGVAALFAMVIGLIEAGLFSSLAAYSMVIVGLLLAGFGLAAVIESRRSMQSHDEHRGGLF